MNKKRIILIIALSIGMIWLSFFITDNIRCKNDKEPIFCIEVAAYKDGGSKKYIGLFYTYYRVRAFNPEISEHESCSENCYLTDYVITPWFFGIDYAKQKAFRK